MLYTGRVVFVFTKWKKYGIIPNFDSERESVGKKKIPGNNTWKILMSHSAGNIKNKNFSKVTKRNNKNNMFFKLESNLIKYIDLINSISEQDNYHSHNFSFVSNIRSLVDILNPSFIYELCKSLRWTDYFLFISIPLIFIDEHKI